MSPTLTFPGQVGAHGEPRSTLLKGRYIGYYMGDYYGGY